MRLFNFYIILYNVFGDDTARREDEEIRKNPILTRKGGGPLVPNENTYNFPPTEREKKDGWSLSSRCGQSATSGQAGDQRGDTKCPNVLVINTDDMAWGDLTINNPSKLVPTPNIDKLVSKAGCL